MQLFIKAILLFASLLCADAAAQETVANSKNVALTDLAGEYIGEDGSIILVDEAEGVLRLTSGPMTFTLVRQNSGSFIAKERALEFRFSGPKVEVVEQGKVVATAEKGARPPPAVTYQGLKFAEWADQEIPSLLERYRVPAAAIAYIREGASYSPASMASADAECLLIPLRCSTWLLSLNRWRPKCYSGWRRKASSTWMPAWRQSGPTPTLPEISTSLD